MVLVDLFWHFQTRKRHFLWADAYFDSIRTVGKSEVHSTEEKRLLLGIWDNDTVSVGQKSMLFLLMLWFYHLCARKFVRYFNMILLIVATDYYSAELLKKRSLPMSPPCVNKLDTDYSFKSFPLAGNLKWVIEKEVTTDVATLSNLLFWVHRGTALAPLEAVQT